MEDAAFESKTNSELAETLQKVNWFGREGFWCGECEKIPGTSDIRPHGKVIYVDPEIFILLNCRSGEPLSQAFGISKEASAYDLYDLHFKDAKKLVKE
jgi:hypothetical protein